MDFTSLGAWEMTAALARTNMKTFRITLNDGGYGMNYELYSPDELGLVAKSAGFLFSSILGGASLCELRGDIVFSPVVQQGKILTVTVKCDETSDEMLGAICSAVAEVSSLEKVKFVMGDFRYIGSVQEMTPARWGWIVYALCCKTHEAELECTLPRYSRMKEYVSVTRAVLKTGYPEPVLERKASSAESPAQYGFVDVPEGGELRPRGLMNDDDTTIVLIRPCRCRALYGPVTMNDVVDVVVPGYGICQMSLGADDRAKQFIRDDPADSSFNLVPSRCIQRLHIIFEGESILTDLLLLIGGGLRKLNASYCANGEVFLNVNEVAIACPDLKDIYLCSFRPVLSSGKELRDWGIAKLVNHCRQQVRGLLPCLGDENYRMSRELKELQIHQHPAQEEYLSPFKLHHAENLALIKEHLPICSKLAMISATTNSRKATTIDHLDRDILSLIFNFAATPKHRIVLINPTH